MNKRIFTLLLSMLVCAFSFAQKPRAEIDKATADPQIDGVIDELWANVAANTIDKVYLTDVPTLGDPGTTYWKALWNDDGIFILINVNDNVFAPAYVYGAGDNWKYDMVEVYFDANYLKEDSKGANDANGHYQIAFNYTASNVNGELNTTNEGVKYAFKVTGGAYVQEYFVPYTKLKDSDGNQVDTSGEIGFDMYVIDSDSDQPERQRATWANTGGVAESYDIMDDCGIITLKGNTGITFADEINISGPDAITADNDTIRLVAEVLPAEASVKAVNWSVINVTGKARIDVTGLLTAVSNGTVTVVASAADGSYVTSEKTITISGQETSSQEMSVFQGGTFDLDGPLDSPDWGKGGGVGSGSVIDGAFYAEVPTGGSGPNFQLTNANFIVDPDVPYVLLFDAWTDAEVASRTVICDFEDPGNSYERYGDSPDGVGGKSEWNDIATPEKQTFIHYVTFTRIKANTQHRFIFQLGNEATNVNIDNVFLFTEQDYISGVKSLTSSQTNVYPNPAVNELNVSLSAPSKIAIYNISGQKLIERFSNERTAKINVSQLTKGIYFVKVNDSQSVKFVK